jgi:hypothetical protein
LKSKGTDSFLRQSCVYTVDSIICQGLPFEVILLLLLKGMQEQNTDLTNRPLQ